MSLIYDQFSNYLFAKAEQRGIPLSGTFELTSRCNLDCRMCYIHKRANDRKVLARERSAADWLALAETCAEAGTLMLLLTGGEPTLRPDFREIYSGCRRLGMLLSLNTNGTLLDEGLLDFLAEDPPVRVNLTLYGTSRETYGALCGDPGAYDRAMAAILGLRQRGVMVKLNFTATPYNLQDMEQVYAFARAQNLPVQTTTYMFPPVRACEEGCFGCDRMAARESAEAQVRLDRLRFSTKECGKRWENKLKGIREPEPDRECQELPTETINCRAGWSTFWVTWDGILRPCGMMTEPGVTLKTAGEFPEAWRRLRQLRQEILFPAKCSGCELRHACDMCPALCYAETGSFTEVPTYMCQRTAAYLERIREELKKVPPEN